MGQENPVACAQTLVALKFGLRCGSPPCASEKVSQVPRLLKNPNPSMIRELLVYPDLGL